MEELAAAGLRNAVRVEVQATGGPAPAVTAATTGSAQLRGGVGGGGGAGVGVPLADERALQRPAASQTATGGAPGLAAAAALATPPGLQLEVRGEARYAVSGGRSWYYAQVQVAESKHLQRAVQSLAARQGVSSSTFYLCATLPLGPAGSDLSRCSR